MIRFLQYIGIGLILTSTSACRHELTSVQEFGSWLNEEQNGCIMTRSINGIQLSVCYLPYPYMAALEMRKNHLTSRTSYDSLVAAYKYQVNFLMSIKSNDGQNVLYQGLNKPEEYSERLTELNFNLEQAVSLTTNKHTYAAALTSMENTYGLSKGITMNLVFSPERSKEELLSANTLEFNYSDETFHLGTIHCAFDKKNIDDHLPAFTGFKN